MSRKDVIEKLRGQVIISCQAYEDTPLYGPDNMKTMAASVIMGGAKVLRACWPQDIKAIKSLNADITIVGIFKHIIEGKVEGTYPIITPNFEDARSVIEAGADIIALDCTIFKERDENALKALLQQIRDAYPDVPIMADLGRYSDAKFCKETGLVDIISTTLSDYYTHSGKVDTDLILQIKELGLPVNAEGKIWDNNDLKQVLDCKPYCCTIGSAVTRPHLITKHFLDFAKNYE